jgi:copper chaperone CopZ
MSTVTVQIRTVYGVETVYPSCRQSMIFARIAGTKTLTADTLKAIQDLGFKIEIEQPTVMLWGVCKMPKSKGYDGRCRAVRKILI